MRPVTPPWAVMDSRSKRADLGTVNVHLLQRAGAIAAMFGQTVAAALYAALVGFYVEKFGSLDFGVKMLACLYTPYPLSMLVQEKADSYFETRFSTRVTYYFRVVLMQLGVATTAIVWMVMPQSPYGVLAVGVLIGCMNGAMTSSAKQMVAAMNPRATVYGAVGIQLSYLQPLLLFYAVGFNPSAPISKFREVIAYVVCASVVTFIILNVLHFRSDAFTKAYERLSYDMGAEEETFGEAGVRRPSKETEPLFVEDAKHGVPRWVEVWCTMSGFFTFIKTCQMSLTASFGGSALAQTLILTQFGAELAGMFAVLPIPTVPCFAEGPWHRLLFAMALSMVAIVCVQLARLCGIRVADPIFLLSWAGLGGIWSFSNSLIELTVTSYVRMADRKHVAKKNRFAFCAGLVHGLFAGHVITRFL